MRQQNVRVDVAIVVRCVDRHVGQHAKFLDGLENEAGQQFLALRGCEFVRHNM